ncbi:MAG TPA: DUF3568 family protein [Verrucomicrobiota bacterium]|nr:DUF3568 family protein [Verrucomicrobiota bacterium]HNU50725.1 DUF3568 family protein [Verrucomicrobiota bacterium]
MGIDIRHPVRRALQWTGHFEAAAEKKAIQILSVVGLGLGLVLLPGCLAVAGAAAAAGTVVYVKGEVQSTLDAPLPQCVTAVEKVIIEFKLSRVGEEIDGTAARVKARNAQDQAVTFRLKRLTDRATSVSIRVGTWGDEAASVGLLEAVKKSL